VTGTPASASVPLAALGVVKEEGALKLNPCGRPSSRPYGLLVVAEELHRHDDQPTSSATQLDGPRRSLASLSRDPTSIAGKAAAPPYESCEGVSVMRFGCQLLRLDTASLPDEDCRGVLR